jgi:Uma2 family endonuclease
MIAERRQLGLDHLDEMWEGELHMGPPPSNEHGRIGLELVLLLAPPAKRMGLDLRGDTTGVFDPAVPTATSYRVPDLSVFAPDVGSERGIEGGTALVIEIASPGDESLAKVPFYSRVGVGEMVRIDRDTKEVRRWVRTGGVGLTEVTPEVDGWHRLGALPVAARGADGVLEVEVGGEMHRI